MKEKEIENIESEDLESEDMKTYDLKRVPDLDKNDTMKKVLFMIPNKWYKKIGNIAVERECSKGSILREALRDYFSKTEKKEKIEESTNPNPKATINDEEFTSLIQSCENFWGGFQTVDNGFFDKFKEKNWKLSDLTDEQFIYACHYLNLGYQGFAEPPGIEKFMSWVEELEPTDQQSKLLTLTLQNYLTFDNEDLKKTVENLISEIEK